jgi:hypothetical protein
MLPAHQCSVLEASLCEVGRRSVKVLSSAPPMLALIAGSGVRLWDLSDGSIRTLFARGGFGLGAISAHPSGRILAVAERAAEGYLTPAIRLYEYPSLRELCSLEQGTERAFSDLSFRLVASA